MYAPVMTAADGLGDAADAADGAGCTGDEDRTPAAASRASKRCRTSPSKSFSGSKAFSLGDGMMILLLLFFGIVGW